MQSVKSLPKINSKTNLLGKGKTEKDNELIASTMKIN